MNRSDYHFSKLPPEALNLAKKFYKASGYSNKVSRDDEVYVLRARKKIIASARIVTTNDLFMLRSMVVAPALRRQGLGRLLLEQITEELGSRTLWCLPFSNLIVFYQASGFSLAEPSEAPGTISSAYERYSGQGRDLKIMVFSQN